jgi:hypothetical protein
MINADSPPALAEWPKDIGPHLPTARPTANANDGAGSCAEGNSKKLSVIVLNEHSYLLWYQTSEISKTTESLV